MSNDVLRSRTLKRYNMVLAESAEYLMNEVLLRIMFSEADRHGEGHIEGNCEYACLCTHFAIARPFGTTPQAVRGRLCALSGRETHYPD